MQHLDELIHCSPQIWYDLFSKHAIKARFIPVSDEFISYLSADGLVLPKNSHVALLGRDELSDDEELKSVEDDECTRPVFDELNNAITTAISDFGGKVFVKLSWNSAVDAVWINGGSAQCCSAGDVYMLLKSSLKIADSIEVAQSLDTSDLREPALVIKKWSNLHPSMEYRCFVKDRSMIGISQRNCSTYFEFLADDAHRIKEVIFSFFSTHVQPSEFPLSSYTIDVYVDKKNRVWIVDFGLFGDATDSLLYSWEELNDIDTSECDIRVVMSQNEVLPHQAGSTRGPVDMTEVQDPISLMMQITKGQMKQDSSSDDES
mmetsp:Transcript_14824/g.22316  ORF Transcript_14824/g.22316 Transcript_14824/m.22316 type:complete len:318 (-) Transcript_14824:29-982(-)